MKQCLECGEELKGDFQKKFCNRSCSAKYNNRKREFRGSGLPNCAHCGTSLRNKKGKRYCGNSCKASYEREASITKSIVTGQLHEKSITGLKGPKTQLIKIRGHRCEICDTTEWIGQDVPLVFDHIDGNSENGSLKNCRLVCGNCDMQLDTYKAKNKGNGRHWRNQRRLKGKSF